MPCRNPSCARNNVSEDELIRLTAQQLRQTDVPVSIASQMGAAAGCAKCSMMQIASWLDELAYLREMRKKYQISAPQ